MIQVWLIDKEGFYLNKSKFVEEVLEGMTTTPLTVGYIKPKLVKGEWTEGATEEEIQAWKDSQPVPTPLIPTDEMVVNLIIASL